MDALFFTLHSGLPHEGPGSREDTLRALALTGLSGRLAVLDIGCGPGPSSLVLLEALPEARVTGVDDHAPFIEAARARVAAAGHGPRFAAVEADMAALPFEAGSFDLLWCEGAVYIMGVERALGLWRPLLRPGGRIAFTEAVWLVSAPHPEAQAVWAEYPEMTDVDGVSGRIAATGARQLGRLTLQPRAWEAYYAPLEARLDALAPPADAPADGAADGAADATLARAIAAHRTEIAVWRAHGDSFGYVVFVVAP